MVKSKRCLLLTGLALLALSSVCEAKKPKDKPQWAKKDLRDYSDADLERLYEQWEEDDEPIPVDELPDHDPRKPQPSIDFSKLDMSNPESVIRATKKGKTLMMFVKVSGKPDKQQTEEITSLWQTGLWNNHVQTERFLLDDDRVIFMFKDGEQAFEAKDFLVEQERCEDVQLEQQTYCGVYSETCEEEQRKKKEKEGNENLTQDQENKKKGTAEKKKKEKDGKDKSDKKKKDKNKKDNSEKKKKDKSGKEKQETKKKVKPESKQDSTRKHKDEKDEL